MIPTWALVLSIWLYLGALVPLRLDLVLAGRRTRSRRVLLALARALACPDGTQAAVALRPPDRWRVVAERPAVRGFAVLLGPVVPALLLLAHVGEAVQLSGLRALVFATARPAEQEGPHGME